MKKLIPPHPPLEKGGWGDLKTILTPTPAYRRQAHLPHPGGSDSFGVGGIRLTPYSSGLKLMLLQALLLPLRSYNGQKPSTLPLPE